MKVGPEAIISVIRKLESIAKKQTIWTAILEEHGKILKSRSNQNAMTLYQKLCK
jgi:hypothetical protein